MEFLKRDTSLLPFVKDIVVLQNDDPDTLHHLPFYADGLSGVIYSESTNPFFLYPQKKQLSEFYLHGQTIKPIALSVKGKFKILGFMLYPFAARLLLGIDPKVLNDDCFDLRELKSIDTLATINQLNKTKDLNIQVDLIANFLKELVKISAANPDHTIKLAVNLILKSKGQASIKKIREQLFITERTFERRFAKEIGVSPKQFAKIVQFNFSLNQIKEEDYASLTELGNNSGFADQSHFIRTFKRFTGKTPKEFQKQLSA